MDSYEQYEQDCEKIREVNEKIMDGFSKWLSDKGLSPKTISSHCNNVDFYINTFLLHEEATDATDGVYEIDLFLGFWFIKKAMWASKSSIKSNATSIRKFYEYMLEKGMIDEEDYNDLKGKIKNNMQEWLETMDRYDDPEIEDMEEVWDL